MQCAHGCTTASLPACLLVYLQREFMIKMTYRVHCLKKLILKKISLHSSRIEWKERESKANISPLIQSLDILTNNISLQQFISRAIKTDLIQLEVFSCAAPAPLEP